MTAKEANEMLRWIRVNERQIDTQEDTIVNLVSGLAEVGVGDLSKTLHIDVSYEVAANALTAVLEIKDRIVGGESSGESISGLYVYDFYIYEYIEVV